MAKKGVATKVRLESEAGTGYRYYTKVGKNATNKLRVKKFDPWYVNPETGKKGGHVYFAQKKLPPAKKN